LRRGSAGSEELRRTNDAFIRAITSPKERGARGHVEKKKKEKKKVPHRDKHV
jgi:hypothetical protein